MKLESIRHYWHKHWGRITAGLSVMLVLVLAEMGWVPPLRHVLEAADMHLYDLKVELSLRNELDETVVIVDIDERSLAALGQWPWSRAVMGRINDRLFDDYKVQVLGYDIVWAEPDAINPKSLKAYVPPDAAGEALTGRLPDALFAKSMRDRNVVLGYYFSNEAQSVPTNELPAPVLSTRQLPQQFTDMSSWKAYTGNLPDINRSAAAAGFFNPFVDSDGVIRRSPLLIRYGENYYESLPFSLVRQALGMQEVGVRTESQGAYQALEQIELGPLAIPVARDASVFVPYVGHERSFRYVSLVDVLNAKAPREWLEGKIAIMGSSAPGLRDQRSTPFASVYPGVEIHANIVSGILNDRIPKAPDYGKALVVLQLLILGVLLALFMPKASAVVSMVMTFAGLGVAAAVNYHFWSAYQWIVPVASVLILTLTIFVINVVSGYFVEGRAQRQIIGLFGQYVPQELVQKMAEDPAAYSMETRDSELSIMFTDIRGFTSLSETMTPRQLSEFINEYLNTMTACVMDEHGTIDKYIGDAVMAFWGAPMPEPKHAFLAVKAGLKMQEQAHALSERLVQRGFPAFRMGLGINTGLVRVGDMGSDLRRTYTVIGDPVNLASRLEGLTKYYACDILVSDTVVAQAPEYLYRQIDKVRVKGKDVPVTLFSPLGLTASLTQDLQQAVAAWNDALELFYAQRWDDFLASLSALRSLLLPHFGEDVMLDKYQERAEHYRQNPPPQDWDGIVNFDEK